MIISIHSPSFTLTCAHRTEIKDLLWRYTRCKSKPSPPTLLCAQMCKFCNASSASRMWANFVSLVFQIRFTFVDRSFSLEVVPLHFSASFRVYWRINFCRLVFQLKFAVIWIHLSRIHTSTTTLPPSSLSLSLSLAHTQNLFSLKTSTINEWFEKPMRHSKLIYILTREMNSNEHKLKLREMNSTDSKLKLEH